MVVVFLICHSVKLIINAFEVYQLVKSNVKDSAEETTTTAAPTTTTTANQTFTGEEEPESEER